MSTTNVTAKHRDYAANRDLWDLVRDAAAGEKAVKDAREKYLPRPNPADKSVQAEERFKQYLTRAVYYNATGRTLRTMVGIAFHREPTIKMPTALEECRDNINGAGLTLLQQAQATLGEVLRTGRAGLLADFPKVDDPQRTSLAAQRAQGLQPTLTLYHASAIINWRTTMRGGKVVLSLVVLEETRDIADGFATKSQTQYRVLRLDDAGLYQVEIWRKDEDATKPEDQWVLAETNLPLDGTGRRLTEIPFQFVGAQDNDYTVDESPLYDIATLNMAHYRNSADYEESVFFCGQPQYWIAGLTEEWRDHLEKTGVYVGSRTILPLPVNGSAGILQADPNTLAKEAMEGKEKQMAALGARLLFATSQIKTATQQESEDTTTHSVLSLACENVASAYTKGLQWMAMFANAGGEVEFKIPTDFAALTMDPTELTALLQLAQAGKLPDTDLWDRLRKCGLIAADKDDEAIREELDAQAPARTSNPFGNGDDDPADDDDDQQAAA